MGTNLRNDEDWDQVVNLEQYAYERGRAEAVVDLSEYSNDGQYHQGRGFGMSKGYAIAMELTFYEYSVRKVLESKDISGELS